MALEAGRKYVFQDEKKPKRKTQKPMSFEMLDKIEAKIFNDNIKDLARSESVDRIKFPHRVVTELDKLVQIPNKFRLKRRSSIPGKFDFESYKKTRNYEKSKLHEELVTNVEKEWTREIWCEWFDEVIPQLDGSGGREGARRLALEKKKLTRSNTNISIAIKGKNDETNADAQAGDNKISDDGDDDEDDKQRILKSPTPYEKFEQINLDQIDPTLIKTLETEIEVLTKRIETRTTCFDLARRGALYRKLGFIKLALNDLNKALDLEGTYIDALWQRHLIYLVQDKKKNALSDLDMILKLNRTHAGAYLSRYF
jgi:tetratricopeptide (TPR) repeat protein